MMFDLSIGKVRLWLNLRSAFKKGLRVGIDFRCMGGTSFGSEPYLIRIGNHVTISSGVSFVTHDGGTWVFRDSNPEYKGITKFGPIRVMDNCFIGHGSVIMPNVSIGPNCVIGAHSVVTKCMPPDTICAGIPARPIMSTREYIEKIVAANQRAPIEGRREYLEAMFAEFLESGL